ncbi:MAG: ATP-binding protein, partial [Solirubrobacteraceae bacterium]
AGLALGGTALARGTEAARELAAREPFRESAHALLMRLLASAGDVAEGIRVYEELRVRLRDELGTVPSPPLVALHEQLVTAPAGVVSEQRGARSVLTVSPPAAEWRALPRPLRRAVGELPFTGREHELARLTGSWTEFDVRARRVAVISGEAGIGKTRVAAELAAKVHWDGSQVLYGRCDEGLAVPYQPFLEALRSLLPGLDLDRVRAALGGLAPELGRLLPELTGLGSPAPADAESARYALFEAVVALLELTAAEQRTLLVIDDVQWAAPATLLLLRHVIRSERPLALLLVVTYRNTGVQPDEPLAALLADLQRDSSVQRIALTGLDEPAIGSLLRSAVGPVLADRAAQLAARIHAETAGNPFFVRELVAHLLETGALAGLRDAAALPPASLEIPEGLRSVVGQRVARLSDTARQVMRIASATAGTIELRLLESLLPEGGLLDALDETAAAGLLVESAHGEFAFTHALVRRAVYDNLSNIRRLYLHRRLGEALEARGDTEANVEALAHHFAQLARAGELDKATSYAIAAGHAASDRLASEDAVAHFQRGLDMLAAAQEPEGRRHIDLLLGLGHVRWSTGESDRARAAYTRAAEIADATGDAAAVADAALGFSGPFFEVGAAWTRSSVGLLQRALAMLDEHDGVLRARLLSRLAAARTYTGGPNEHRAMAHEALAIARRSEDAYALAEVLATSYWVTRGPDDPGHNLRLARELTALAEDVGDVRLLAYGHGTVIGHRLEQGDIDGALRELDELADVASTRNDRYARWLLAANRALLACVEGRLDRAESFALEAIGQWADRPLFSAPAQLFGGQLFQLRREQGRLGELLDVVAAHVEQAPEVPAWRCALVHIHVQLGDRDRACEQLDLLGDLSSLTHEALWMLSVTLVGTAASLLDDRSRSRRAYEMLAPYADIYIVNPSLLCEGSTSRPLGMLATTLGRYGDAERHFERALEMNAGIRSRLWTAHTQCEYARMLRLRGGPDQERARAMLARAIATADELGLHAIGRRAAD